MSRFFNNQNRRSFLRSFVAGSTLMPGIFRQLQAADGGGLDPLAPKSPHFPAKAKNVIFLFMTGGVSHVDTFDHKPKLTAMHGEKVPESFMAGKRLGAIDGKKREKALNLMSEKLEEVSNDNDSNETVANNEARPEIFDKWENSLGSKNTFFFNDFENLDFGTNEIFSRVQVLLSLYVVFKSRICFEYKD